MELVIGEETIWAERRWRELGAKTKVFVNGDGMDIYTFQRLLLSKLGIPLLNFPKGNPMSGQTWPELTFRMLLRHMYRQQRFWSGLADQQPEGEQHAVLMQFLGIAEPIFSKDYGELVRLKREVEALKAQRDQHKRMLDSLARELLSESGLTVGASEATLRAADERIKEEIKELQTKRLEVLAAAKEKAVSIDKRSEVERFGEQRAEVLVRLEQLRYKSKGTDDRIRDVRQYIQGIRDEVERLNRAADAGSVLADLKVTHCPACDQTVTAIPSDSEHCFLCHQALTNEPVVEGLGAVRLRFEFDRLVGELKEGEELLNVLERDSKKYVAEIQAALEQLRMLDNQLAPARDSVSALAQDEVSAIDMALGELNERQRHLGRIWNELGREKELTSKVVTAEQQIVPLQARIDELSRALDYGAAAAELENGMNEYLSAINLHRPGIWRHSSVAVDLSRSTCALRVGSRRWQSALGGTDTLYFIMAYHYGLLALSNKPKCNYPGLCIIDVPGEFSGELIEDKENFIVQPFIDLLTRDGYSGAQAIITGASFKGLSNVNRLQQSHVYVA